VPSARAHALDYDKLSNSSQFSANIKVAFGNDDSYQNRTNLNYFVQLITLIVIDRGDGSSVPKGWRG